jgi:hypothetical protein
VTAVEAERESNLPAAVTDFVTTDSAGNPRFISAGMKLREPVGAEKFWLKGDVDDADIAQRRLELDEDASRAQANRDARASEAAERADRPGRRVRARTSFEDYPNVDVTEGEIYLADSPVVIRCPEGFEEIEED